MKIISATSSDFSLLLLSLYSLIFHQDTINNVSSNKYMFIPNYCGYFQVLLRFAKQQVKAPINSELGIKTMNDTTVPSWGKRILFDFGISWMKSLTVLSIVTLM